MLRFFLTTLYTKFRSAHGLKKMDLTTWVQILNKLVYISPSSDTLGRGMNPTILHPVMGK